jgi:hypothetical protein
MELVPCFIVPQEQEKHWGENQEPDELTKEDDDNNPFSWSRLASLILNSG